MTENNVIARPVLVTGATGMTGSRVLAGLRELGVPTRAASRSSEWRFDWSEPETWETVLEGAGAVYLVQDDTNPRTPEFVERAVAHGVERIVRLSARGVDQPGYFEGVEGVPSHVEGEEAVKSSGLEWTVLRPGWFAQNFSEGFLTEGARTGVLRLPTGEAAASWIDTEDIAAVAVAALTEPDHHGRTYELSGPRALTVAEALVEISEALGRPIRYEAVPVDEYVKGLVEQGWPEEGAQELVSALSAIRRGLEAKVSPGVREALGREPRDFSEFVKDAFVSGDWNT
ncbi:SDR family oxidoreductase [Nocardiopsis valliformis]|uniref:SDR family oxidoreductase n=1 Tax=Nocardiopsis valliformis TaxID=239974 RepID=UPI00034B5602|nr:SDR family oxidoreductase [Nocardiopsis valliformis]